VLDIHSHILPSIDDGVKTLEESLDALKGLYDLGFRHIVATPHFYPGKYTPSIEEIQVALEEVKELIRRKNIAVTIILGRECFLDYELVTARDRSTFPFLWNNIKYQLIELPQMSVPAAISSYVQTLRSTHIVPILAHAERYNQIIRDPDRIHHFISLGFRIQIDLASFAPTSNKALRETALSLLRNNLVDIVASDIHRPSQLEALSKGLEFLRKECGNENIEQFFSLP